MQVIWGSTRDSAAVFNAPNSLRGQVFESGKERVPD